MKTLIFRTSTSGEECPSVYFVFQYDEDKVEHIQSRFDMFKALGDASVAPTYMSWLGECWGFWIPELVLERYLDDLEENFPGGLDAYKVQEEIDEGESGYVFIGDVREFIPEYYIINDDERSNVQIRTDAEEMIISQNQNEVFFQCLFSGTGNRIQTREVLLDCLNTMLGK